MERCKICRRPLDGKKLIILTAPELHVVDCEFCGTGQLIDTPMKEDWEKVNRSFGVSPSLMEEKRNQIKKFLYYVYTDNNNPKVFEIGGMDEFADLGIRNLSSIKSKTSDAFVCLYYLEHFPHPDDLLISLNIAIRAGGYGFIQVPNYDHIKATKNWLEYTQEHRTYFTEFSLTYLLVHCGFEIVKVDHYNDGLCLSVIVRKPKFQNISIMKEGMKLAEERFKRLIDSLPKPIAIYGAGHYTQLLLNMAKAKYGWVPARIFDSNVSKIGTLVGNIMVEGKEGLMFREYKSIIISCGMYNDEVYEMLNNMKLGKEIVKWN
jgi:hypothetical protein